VISTFVNKAINGEPLPIHGSGEQTRSLCFVSDLVRGLVALADSGETGPINIGNPNEQTLLQIAERIIALSKSDSQIEFHPRPVDDPERRKPDITKATALLGWVPEVHVDEGLSATIEWYRSQRG
jgi:dTDP-glucose 4,6-dehydratase